MFVGYPYSHEDLEKIDAEIKKNREEHPEYGSITRTIAAVIGLIIWSIFLANNFYRYSLLAFLALCFLYLFDFCF